MTAEYDNRITPTSEGAPSTSAGVKDDLDAFDAGAGEAESRGGDHRPIQDNGTQGHNSSVQGQMSGNKDFPTIRDQFASYAPTNAEGSKQTINEFGFGSGNEEVGHDGNQLCYGIEGPAAGGGDKRNTKA